MDRGQVRAFAQRDRLTAEAGKRQHWAREFSARGPAATVEASVALWRHMRMIRPDWPTDEERRDDLAHHVALKRAIDRAARVLARIAPR